MNPSLPREAPWQLPALHPARKKIGITSCRKLGTDLVTSGVAASGAAASANTADTKPAQNAAAEIEPRRVLFISFIVFQMTFQRKGAGAQRTRQFSSRTYPSESLRLCTLASLR